MRNLVYAALASAAIVAMAPAAQASHQITLSEDGDSISGTFTNEGLPQGDFSDVFEFFLPDGMASFTASSSAVLLRGPADLDFTSITFNGLNFAVGSTGQVDFRFLTDAPVLSGTQTLVVNGFARGNGSYSGTIAFAAANAVPEPATWAMMLVGFGAVGYSLRRRKTTYQLAQAV